MADRKQHKHRFTAPLERQPGRYGWSYVEFPEDVATLFGRRGEVRVKCLINGIAADRSLMPTRSGLHILSLNADLRKAAGIHAIGDPVEVELWPDPTPATIVIPEELQDTFELLPTFRAAWDRLTPGRRRDLCRWVDAARTAPTRAKRIAEILRRSEQGEHPFGKAPRAAGDLTW